MYEVYSSRFQTEDFGDDENFDAKVLLERQVAAMSRLGLEVDSQTLFDQLWGLQRLLLPAYQRLADVEARDGVPLPRRRLFLGHRPRRLAVAGRAHMPSS